jgi:ABC-type nitrate/sulfonate/bicarbonate transport system substrate-binding protein
MNLIGRVAFAVGLAVVPIVSASAADNSMRIATGVDPGFAHFYVATQAGILKKQGLDVELVTGSSGGATVPLLIGGESTASMSAALAGIRNHVIDDRIVAVAQVVAYDKWYGVVASKNIATTADLKGKKIGIAVGTASETMWNGLLAHEKFDAKSFAGELVPVEPPEMLAALERGDIDAFSSWEPWLTRTKLAVQGSHILQSNDGIFLDVGFIYMNRDWIEANKEKAVAFMKGMVESTKLINENPAEAQKIVSAYLQLPPALTAELMPKLTFSLKLDAQSYDQTKLIVDGLKASGSLKKDFNYKSWFYPDLLRSVDPSRVSLKE